MKKLLGGIAATVTFFVLLVCTYRGMDLWPLITRTVIVYIAAYGLSLAGAVVIYFIVQTYKDESSSDRDNEKSGTQQAQTSGSEKE